LKQLHDRSTAIALLLLVANIGGFSVAQEKNDVVIIPPAQSRSYMLTNTSATFLFAETGGTNTSVMQGLSVKTEEYFEDYLLEINGSLLSRESSESHLFSNRLVRKYTAAGLEEDISLLDSIPIMTIKLTAKQKQSVAFTPIIAKSNEADQIRQAWTEEDNILYLSTQSRIQKANSTDIPKLTAICTYPISEYHEQTGNNATYHGKVKQSVFIPGKLKFDMDGTAYIFIIVGENKADILQKRKYVLRQLNIYFENSSKKIEGVRQT
jgi:hypothetical protein